MDDQKGKGIPFIIHDAQKGYIMTEQAENFLNSLSEAKLGVISVVGKYRTGKSFFINRVLLEEKGKGFNVGPTINPCTKVSSFFPIISGHLNPFDNVGTMALE